MEQNAKTSGTAMTKKLVMEFLRAHPNFLNENPDLLEVLTPPKQKMGDKVVDFQHYALGNLQRDFRELKDRFNGLLTSARDNMSVQQQIHKAVLSLVKARDLEQLLEVLTIDLVNYFDVDVVRLAMESEMVHLYAQAFGDQHFSGLSFVEPGLTDLTLGKGEAAFLVTDAQQAPPYGFELIFADCASLIASCALLRLELETIQRPVILAFGVRDIGRFQPNQGVELLQFLARIVEHRLDQCMNETEIEKLR